jgi:hypothetical protein
MSATTAPRAPWTGSRTPVAVRRDDPAAVRSPSRRPGLAVALVGAACFALLLAALLPLWVYPRLVQLPMDPQENEVQTAANATVLVPDLKAAAGARVIHGARVSITTFVSAPKVGDFGPGTAVWLLATRVNVAGHGLLSAQVERISLDRRTAAPTNCCGDSLVTDAAHPGGVPLVHRGYLTWPFGVQQKTYPLWTVSLNRSRPARFEGVEHRAGLRVYKFVATNSWVDTGTQALPGALFGLKAASVTATAQYADTQTSWVEPNSGAPVDMTDQVGQRYVYQGRVVTAMSADLVSAPLPAQRMRQLREGAVVLPWLRARGVVTLVVLSGLLFAAAAALVRRRTKTVTRQPVSG